MAKRIPKKKRDNKNIRNKKRRKLMLLIGTTAALMISVSVFGCNRIGLFLHSAKGYQEDMIDVIDVIDVSDEIDGEQVPLFLQSDERWGDNHYGDGHISKTGCGPTCLSMVYCYLTGDASMHPGRMAAWAEREGFYAYGTGTRWSLMDDGAEELGLQAYTDELSEENILDDLSSGHVIICSVAPGDFTTEGHFIVLAGLNDDGTVKVNDPNSKKRSEKEWDVERILPQIKQFWVY